jgi:hypothetical protein
MRCFLAEKVDTAKREIGVKPVRRGDGRYYTPPAKFVKQYFADFMVSEEV